MEESAALLQGLVQNLIEHSKNEISRVGRPGKAAKIGESLEMIQEYLNEAEKRDGRDVNIWLTKLEDVAFDAYNLLDELSYHSLSKQVKSLKQSAGFSFFNNIIVRSLDIATRIQKFNKDLESIKKEAGRLRLGERLHPDVPALVNATTYETDSFSLDPIFVGRDEVVRDVIEILTTVITTDARISIVAIVGMGGVGKTVLTRKVFDFLKKKTHFESHIWVHVSQFFDPKSLFKKILKELTSSDQVQVESMEDILEMLEEALRDKTYLFVLDDVWNEDPVIWEYFINHLLEVTCNKGNAIVVTTRIMSVAVTVNAIHTLPLTGVSDEDCWSIIKAKSLGNKDFPLAFEAIGRRIAARCQGLPLAANVVGGVLRTKSEEVWLSVQEKWLPGDEQNHITGILRSSFDNLYPSSLKKCFAYCSIFPKGGKIESLKLIEYWMAEGFLEVGGSNDTNNCMEHTGEKFINILLQNSLLQVAERDDDGNVTSCVMHDYTHDLANSILSSHNIYGMSRVRYMIYEEGSDGSDPISKDVAKYLRTLFVQGKAFDAMFSDFKCLHNLILSGDNFEELPSAVRKLIHLRNLDISNTKIGNLPEWIGELHHLQTLRACKSHLEKPKLPSTLKNLFNLRHLYIKRNTELPPEIGRLTCLQTLPVFRVGKDNGYQIEELGSLKILKGKLEIGNLEKVYDRKEALKANIFEKLNLSELVLRWEASREGERKNETVLDEKSNEAVLEGLQPNHNLKRLKIAGFKGKKFHHG
ncbi:putative disease resistance protein RGA3 [Salvia splendens]|uniref:putative disease resistance protein RGA3 n=1 Tax=Salvia splendens TaxID=180675 RepID=UPI001C27EFE8|nr:putative disease resistance protein RGA3 [Salvia splendens]XP_042027981.1 putative disease resistance protein RGA3 [Salvia splendens]XP_042027982.1 putative disease resistance protein RGA3 [Salvia splendens]